MRPIAPLFSRKVVMNCGDDTSHILWATMPRAALQRWRRFVPVDELPPQGRALTRDRVDDYHVGPIGGGEHVGPAALAPLRGDILETVDAHRAVEGLARQFQPRDEMAFGFPADSVARYGVLDEKTCQIAADPPPKFSLIDNAGPLGGPIAVGAGRVAGGGAKPSGGPARYGRPRTSRAVGADQGCGHGYRRHTVR